MSLLSKDQLAKLIENGKKIENGSDETVPPIVLLRLPNNPPSAWFLASVDPLNHDKAFGLIEIAGDRPELGYVSIKELEDLRGYKNQGSTMMCFMKALIAWILICMHVWPRIMGKSRCDLQKE